jgi:chromate transporter
VSDQLPTLAASPAAVPLHGVSFGEALRVWIKVALLSFGGPAGQIAVMHRLLVEEKRWVNENRFLHALNYCMLLPGPEAQQLATYIGWLLHGVRGGLVAGTLFVLPGFVSILILSILYAEFHNTTFLAALFFGVKPAVIAVVVEAVLRIGKRVLKNRMMVVLAGLSFVALSVFGIPFPLVILSAALMGFAGGRFAPQTFNVVKSPEKVDETPDQQQRYAIADVASGPIISPGWGRTLRVIAIWLLIWWLPVAAVAWIFGAKSVYVQESVFFSKAAMVTFGGAYSVLAYVGQQAVDRFAWLQGTEMLDGLGMAETTPGPLIMVLEFVGFLGAYRNPGALSPLAGGVLGAVLTTWVTFCPCFLWIFVGAPYIEALRGQKLLNAALSAITAAVVGVVLNLALWFAWHTLVAPVAVTHLRPEVMSGYTLDVAALILCVLACLAMFRYHLNMFWTLGGSAVLGMAYYLVFRA